MKSKIESLFQYLLQRKNFLIVIAGQSTAKFLMLLMFIILPAMIGIEEWGSFSHAIYICFVFGQPLVEFGLDPIITKYISRGRDYLIKEAFLLRLKTSFVGFFLTMIVSSILKVNLEVVLIIFLYLFFLSLSNLFFAYFRGKEIFIYESILLPFSRILSIALIYFLSKSLLIKNSFTGAVPFASSAVILFIFTLFYFLRSYRKNLSESNFQINKQDNISLFKEGGFIFFSALLTTVYFRVDGVILGSLISETELGIYSLSYRFYEGSIMIPAAFMMVVFPKISSMQIDRLSKYFRKIIIILFSISIIAYILLYFLGGLIITKFYSNDFSESVYILRYLSLSVFLAFPSYLTTQILIARDQNKLFLIITLSGAIFNLILNFILIPKMKSYGAVLAHILTEILVFSLSFILARWILKKES